MKIKDYVSRGGRLPSGNDTKKSFAKEYDRVVGRGSSGRATASAGVPTKSQVRTTKRNSTNFYYNPQTQTQSTLRTRYGTKADYISAMKNKTGIPEVNFGTGAFDGAGAGGSFDDDNQNWYDKADDYLGGWLPFGRTPEQDNIYDNMDKYGTDYATTENILDDLGGNPFDKLKSGFSLGSMGAIVAVGVGLLVLFRGKK